MNKVVKIKNEKSLEDAISRSSMNFKSIDQGIDILAFSAAIRALGLSNRDLQPKKLSNFIQTLTFFDKVSGINMMKFHPNPTTFYKIKCCSENDC